MRAGRKKFTDYFKTPTYNCRDDEIVEDGVSGSCLTLGGSYKCMKDDPDLVQGSKQRV